jgi:LEA14-like dessication related protein
MRRRAPLRASAVLLLLVAALALPSCSSVEEPKMTIRGVDFEGISTDGLEFVLSVEVSNPNAFGAVIDYVEYGVEVDRREVATGRQIDDVSVPAGATVDVDVPFAVRWDGFRDALRDVFDGGTHDWCFEGTVRLKKGPLTRTFSFRERGTFESPDVVDVSFEIDTGSL